MRWMWIDTITDFEEGTRLEAVKNLSSSEELFHDHFDGEDGREPSPVMPGSLIVDVSCDEGMGFEFAKPTSFESPSFDVPGGSNVTYYAVDHSPSFLWNTATHAISRALLPHIPTVMAGEEAWESSETIRRSIEIRGGVIQNPKILQFQNRAAEWPHARKS